MAIDAPYHVLATSILAVHVAIVAFIIGGLVLIVLGNARHWQWVNAPWFRVVHLVAITAVVAEAWLGVTCPLTTLEGWLRTQAGDATYRAGFIEHWLQHLLYYEGPPWAFVLGYTLFGMLVVFTWWYFPPRFRRGLEQGA